MGLVYWYLREYMAFIMVYQVDSHLEMTKEYFRHRKSDKWRKLYVKFRKAKRRAIRGTHFEEFADQIIKGTKSNFYRQV